MDDRSQGLTSGAPAPGSPAHPAPPPYRPLSALAVTALVLAVFGGLLSLTGLWWLALPGLLLGATAWSALASGKKRGRGVALTAVILSLLAGGVAFTMHRIAAGDLEEGFDPLVLALVQGDRAELERWTTADVAAERLPAWTSRMEAAQAQMGRYTGRLEIGSVWMGVLVSMFTVPQGDIEEFPPRGTTEIGPVEAFWIRAHFEKGPIWLAVVPAGPTTGGPASAQALTDIVKSLASGRRTRVADLRMFRPVSSGVD